MKSDDLSTAIKEEINLIKKKKYSSLDDDIYHIEQLISQCRENNLNDHLIHLLIIKANYFSHYGNPEKANALFDEAMDIALTEASPILQAFIFLNRGDESFNYSNFDEAISLYSQGISIISSTDNVNLKSLLLIKISTTYIRKGDLAMAYKQLHDVLLITDKHNLLQLRANALTLLGDIENENANYYKAADYIIQANNIFLDLGDYYNFAVNLNIIGSFYIDSNNEDAMPYLKQAEEISRKYKYDTILSDALNNIGTIFASQQKYNEALDYFYESVECGKKHFNAFNHANTLHNIADTYKELKEYKKALDFYKKGLKIIDKTDDIFSIVGGYISISDFYLRLNNYDKALQYANKVFDAVIELEDPYYLSHFYKIYYQCYESLGNYEKAYEYFYKYKEYDNCIADQWRHKALKNLQCKFEIDSYERYAVNEVQEEAIKGKKAMLITANHRINQPLMILQGNLDLLKEKFNHYGISACDKNIMIIQKAIKSFNKTLVK